MELDKIFAKALEKLKEDGYHHLTADDLALTKLENGTATVIVQGTDLSVEVTL